MLNYQCITHPKHIAIIMDGNGRWAQKRNLKRTEGHNAGMATAKNIVIACKKLCIPYVTLYAFSKENWGRPKEEVSFLFYLLTSFIKEELHALEKNDIRLNIIGDTLGLPLAVKKTLQHAIKKTKYCQSMVLNLALNYSGRSEILHAVKTLLSQKIASSELTEERFRKYLYTTTQPDPDLVIRTSGERRLSNYLTFQTVYSELFFTNTLWPDFTEKELHTILKEYGKRNRRFGLLQEQI